MTRSYPIDPFDQEQHHCDKCDSDQNRNNVHDGNDESDSIAAAYRNSRPTYRFRISRRRVESDDSRSRLPDERYFGSNRYPTPDSVRM
jgi:hypothetical protein